LHFNSHENRISKRVFVRNESISKAQLIESYPDDEAKSVDKVAQKMFKASSYLLSMYCRSSGVPNKDCVKFMSKYSLPDSNLTNECQKVKNLYLSYRRMLPASYKDGLGSVRRSVNGKELPLSRAISHTLFKSGVDELKRQKVNMELITDEGVLDVMKSLSIVQWSQFIEHDLSKSVARSMSDESAIECCDKESANLQPRYVHESCYPLKIPNDDQNYKKFYVTCLNYVRSALAVNEQCKFGSINQVSFHFSELLKLFDVSIFNFS
jgi:peroxidase